MGIKLLYIVASPSSCRPVGANFYQKLYYTYDAYCIQNHIIIIIDTYNVDVIHNNIRYVLHICITFFTRYKCRITYYVVMAVIIIIQLPKLTYKQKMISEYCTIYKICSD